MFKFFHTADIHLDSPLQGLERYEGVPADEIRGATRRAFENLVNMAINEQVSFILIAGDLYDGDWKDYNTGLFFCAQMSKLRDANISVFIIAGNHDAASKITKQLSPPDNVKFLSVKKPETALLDDLKVAIHGQGFYSPVITDDLSTAYPKPLPHYFNIGLLHTCLDGRQGHDPYAPCTLLGLSNKGYDYWALGHIHKREVLSENPWIVFSGNLQGRHIKETGPKGATLVTVENGTISSIDHCVLDVVRWEMCEVDVSMANTGYDVVKLVQEAILLKTADLDSQILAIRLKIVGRSLAHAQLINEPERWTNQIRSDISENNNDIWIEKIQLQTTTPIDLEALVSLDVPAGRLLRVLRDLEITSIAEFMEEFSSLKNKLPLEYRQLEGAIDFDNPNSLHELLVDVEQFLIPKLLDTVDES